MRGKILYALVGAAVATAVLLVVRRPGGTPLVSALPASEADLAWERPIPEVWLDNVPMERAIVTLCRQASVPVRWDKAALEAADVDLSKPVTMHRRGWPLGDLLQEGVFQLDAPSRSAASDGGSAVPDGDAILITSAVAASGRRVIRLYDLADLLRAKGDLTTVPGRSDYPSPLTVRPVEPIEPFKSLFQDTIAVETWRENGGSFGVIHCVGTRLVIVQSHDAHRQIRR